MAYSAPMEFVETPTFTRLVLKLMADDDYAAMQAALARRPDLGKIIPGSGGIRKMRWAGSGRGKRGGLRRECRRRHGRLKLHRALRRAAGTCRIDDHRR